MKMRFVLAVLAMILAPQLATAANEAKGPSAVDLLFNAPHLNQVNTGQELKYRFKRDLKARAGSEAFEDDILIEVTNETPEKAKNLKLKVFSGERARDPFETPGMTGNPLLIWYLNRCVASYGQVAGGNSMYLKGKIRKALGEEAKVEAVKLEVDGKSIDGHKITVTPFKNDPAKNRMNGYENSTFEIQVSDQVPGYFYRMSANYMSTGKGTAKITEMLTYNGLGEVQ